MPRIVDRMPSLIGKDLPIGMRPSAPVLQRGPISEPLQPIISPILRCPLPILQNNATSDHLRQFYQGGHIPQYRLNPPTPLA